MGLLTDLDATSHAGRVSRVLAAARAKEPELRSLEAGDAFERRWGAFASFVDRDAERVLRTLADPSRTVRGLAYTLVPLIGDDAQVQRALELAWSMKGERRMLVGLSRRGRVATIDRFVEWLHTNGHHRELIDSLSFGSEACVRRFLSVALERPSDRFWTGLAKSHSALFAELLMARWNAVTGEADPVTRQLTHRFHATVVENAPAAALAWCRVLLTHHVQPDDAVWRRLMRRALRETVALAVEFEVELPTDALWKRGKRLDATLLVELMRHAPQAFGGVGAWVNKLAPDDRRALADAWCAVADQHATLGTHLLRWATPNAAREEAFRRWSLESRLANGACNPTLLEALPIELAELEARRHVTTVEALAADPVRRLTSIARALPWAELQAVVAPYLGHPDGAMRVVALRELLCAPGLRPDALELPAKALELVTARKFEQDPVRAAMLEALGTWPKRVWKKDHLPAVGQAIRDALDASDCSHQTAAAAERVIVRLFPLDPVFAAKWLTTLIKERGVLHDANLGAKLSREELAQAKGPLLELATEWERTERFPWLQALCGGLREKLTAIDGLSEVVIRARDRAPFEYVAVGMTQVLERYDRPAYDRTLTVALERFLSRSWYGVLAQLGDAFGNRPGLQTRKRPMRRPRLPQPLIEALTTAALRHPRELGALVTATRLRAPRAFSDLLPRLLAGDESSVILPAVHQFLHRHRQDLLGPFLGHRVIRGSHSTNKSKWILPFFSGFFRWTVKQSETFATALEGIVGDEKRDTPTVFAALIRWPEMPWASMDRLIARAKDSRPAVQEKTIRVLSRCDAGQGVPTLIECLGDFRARFAIYGLRAAVLRMLPAAATEVLSKAPLGKVTVAKEVVRLLGELRDEAAYRRVLELAGSNLHRDVRIAVLRALWDHLDKEPSWVAFEKAVDDPDWVLASRVGDLPADRLTHATDARLSALLARLVRRKEPEARVAILVRAPWLAVVDRQKVFLSACRERLQSRLDDEVRAAMNAQMARCDETDVPALEAALRTLTVDRRMLESAASALLPAKVPSRRTWLLMAEALERVAATDARLAGLELRAVAARVDLPAWARSVESLSERKRLDPDVVRVAIEATLGKLKEEDLDSMVARFAGHADPAVRRVAVGVLEGITNARRWNATRLEQLKGLRCDSVPWVAAAASLLWPPREDDPGFSS